VSGLVAVIFSLIAVFNILLIRVFYATPIKPAGLLGAVFALPSRIGTTESASAQPAKISCTIIGFLVATADWLYQK
jgi:hypothetical protein